MANKTIPQLPLQTGITDNDLLAIVNSGETTTSKIKLSTLLSGVGGGAFQVGDATDSIVPGYSPTSRGVSGSTTYVDKLNIEGEVFVSNANETFNLVSDNTTVTDFPYNRAFAGYANSKISSTNASGGNMLFGTLQGQITNGKDNILLGMGGISSSGQGNFMAGGIFTNRLNAGNFNSIIGGYYHDINSGQGNAIVGGYNTQVSADYSFVGGGTSNSITGRFDNAILAGNSNTNAARYATVLGGVGNNAGNGSQKGGILGGQSNFLSEALNGAIVGGSNGTVSLTWNGVNIGPYNSGIYSNQGYGQDQVLSLYSAPLSNIRQTVGSGTGAFRGGNVSMYNSWTCDIAGQSGNETNFATIIGSESSNIPGGQTHTVMIGCSGRTGTSDFTTYVETLEAFDGVVLRNYASLNFASDGAAATGGVPLGGMYHNSGDMKIRIT